MITGKFSVETFGSHHLTWVIHINISKCENQTWAIWSTGHQLGSMYPKVAELKSNVTFKLYYSLQIILTTEK